MANKIFNITAVKNQMDDVPRSQRINNFFDGSKTQLNLEQLDNIENILKSNFDEIMSHIEDCRVSIKQNEEIDF